ncbi:hypothetical protein Xmau_04096 [Xenorhabdus mauleonii]|uniref:Uncharacterized protein n=1 Tax=Xenorhabdus mauleonii TaxID=351675 RepID=A0A2G0NPR0_9GAMM|nr:hypothetical protein Xmau_04096 [Xenorhabdus mauleonii]
MVCQLATAVSQVQLARQFTGQQAVGKVAVTGQDFIIRRGEVIDDAVGMGVVYLPLCDN